MQQRQRWFRGLVLAFAGGLVVLAVACGGDDEAKGASGSGKATPAPTGRPGTQTNGAAPVRAGLADLTSYKCTLRIEGNGGPLADLESLLSPTGATPGAQAVSFEGNVTFVKPDKAQVSIKLGGETFGQTTIGRQQWSTLGGLTVGPNAVGPQTPSDLSVCASFWDDGFAESASSFQCTGSRESVNGQQTRKCSIDKNTFDQVRQLVGGVLGDPDSGIKDLTRFQMELWVTEGTNSVPAGLPARFRADMAGKDMSNRDFAIKIDLDVTNINDSGLSVAAPK